MVLLIVAKLVAKILFITWYNQFQSWSGVENQYLTRSPPGLYYSYSTTLGIPLCILLLMSAWIIYTCMFAMSCAQPTDWLMHTMEKERTYSNRVSNISSFLSLKGMHTYRMHNTMIRNIRILEPSIVFFLVTLHTRWSYSLEDTIDDRVNSLNALNFTPVSMHRLCIY